MSTERRVPVHANRDWHLSYEERQNRRTLPGGVTGTIPWHVHMKAWEGYVAAGQGSWSAERMAERGGFSYREVQCCLRGCYNECGPDHDFSDHEPVPGWEPPAA